MASRKTTAEIAAGVAVAMTAIYSHLIETGYMDHSDIHWPPHQFPVWRQDVYEAWGLCPEAIEQLRLLPWPCTPNRKQSKSFQFYGNNRAVNYSHHDDVMPSRTAFLSGNGNARAVPLQFNGDVISIFTGTADVSVNVVLDVKLGMIKAWRGDHPVTRDLSNVSRQDAVEFLRRILADFQAMTVLPLRGEGMVVLGTHDYFRRVKILFFEYGGRRSFRRSEVCREISGLWENFKRDMFQGYTLRKSSLAEDQAYREAFMSAKPGNRRDFAAGKNKLHAWNKYVQWEQACSSIFPDWSRFDPEHGW